MQLTWQGCSMETRKSWVQSLPSTMSYVYDSQGPMDKTLSPFKLVWISWVPYFSVRVLRSALSGDQDCWNLHQASCRMHRPVSRNSSMFSHPPHAWDHVFQSTRVGFAPWFRCFGQVGSISFDSVVSDSRYDNFAFLNVSRFGFLFDDFVFEFGERTIFHVGINLVLSVQVYEIKKV